MPKLFAPVVFALAVSSWGCASIPRGRAAIDSVEVVGARAIDPRQVEAKLATEESPKFLGLFRGVGNEFSIYDASVLQRDLARVERYYRGHGFFEAHARVGRVEYVNSNHVRVQIVVDEGAPVINGKVRIEGLELVPTVAEGARKAALDALPRAERFDEDKFKAAQATVLHALTDHGYAYATVQAAARVDLASHTIDYVFSVMPGIPAVYGPITFVGLDPDGAGPEPQEIDEAILRRVMHLRQGAPYSTAELATATQALLDLGVFSAAHIVPGLSDPTQPVVPLVVQLEPTKLRALRLGGGAEFDDIKAEVHAIVGWEDHNLLGNLRDFTVDFTPGLVFYPTTITNFAAPTHYFPEERLRLQLRQPGFLESRTTGFVRPAFNVYPLLVNTLADPHAIANVNVVGYVEPKLSIGLERRFGPHLFVTFAYNLQGEDPFWYKGPCSAGSCSELPPGILLSFPQLTAQLDFRDSVSHPHAGFQINVDLQAAGLGGTARDVRLQPDVEGYIPIARGVTFAVTGALGMLFPFGYGSSVEDLPTQLPTGPGSTLATPTDKDVETVYFRGFFSGGPSSNRGFPLRGVAPHGYVTFLNPTTASAQVANGCDPHVVSTLPPDQVAAQQEACLTPIGGFTMWQASAELRVDVSGPLGLATFCDAGDVSQYVLPDRRALRFNYPHMSCGAGARYDTPVGPIRLDFAYRIPSLQIVGAKNEWDAFNQDITIGQQPRLLSEPHTIPAAIAFGIGEAF